MIEVRELTKRYGRKTAVDRLSFQAKPGHVTGFLGPNGAGKSTTMRALLGLDAPTSGTALIQGRPYAELDRPLWTVGALLDANAAHPNRTAYAHLYCLGRSNGISRSRVFEVLEQVGLTAAAHRRFGGFSLGMKQRLGVAAAMLGDPPVLLFDEPVNGLDPEGIRWIREFLRSLAAQGRTVLISSHLMSELELTVDRVVVIGRGRLIIEAPIAELTQRFNRGVRVHSRNATDLARLLTVAGGRVNLIATGILDVGDLTAEKIGEVAMERGIPISQLTPNNASLEEAYLELTEGSLEYRSNVAFRSEGAF